MTIMEKTCDTCGFHYGENFCTVHKNIPTIIWLSKSPKVLALTWWKWYIGLDEKEKANGNEA